VQLAKEGHMVDDPQKAERRPTVGVRQSSNQKNATQKAGHKERGDSRLWNCYAKREEERSEAGNVNAEKSQVQRDDLPR